MVLYSGSGFQVLAFFFLHCSAFMVVYSGPSGTCFLSASEKWRSFALSMDPKILESMFFGAWCAVRCCESLHL